MNKGLKRLIFTAAMFIFVAVNFCFAQQAKYVFYFIGDGMGLNQVNGTEMYLGELQGKIDISPLCFGNFPATSFATSFSATNSVTDSAAGGTALATGYKTKNGAIGVDVDDNSISSVATWAKNSGKKVGIATSVSIDHATPASFYAHQPNRRMYYEIATDLPKAGFDFYAGAGFLQPEPENAAQGNIYSLFERSGYTISKGYQDFKRKSHTADKIILMDEDGRDKESLTYSIDRKGGELKLTEITECGIEFLTKGNDNGFFLMVEGGKIDWACHDNDAATVFNEVVDMDNAIRIAYDFYQKYPEETLIVVTADHETGGLGLGKGPYTLNLKALANQKLSQGALSDKIKELRKARNNKVSWEDVKTLLKENMGFWDTVELTDVHEKRLRDEYENSFTGKAVMMKESEYARNEPMAAVAKEILNDISFVGWVSGGHSDAYVPIFAIGAGSEIFHGRIDNTDIPKKIAQAAGYNR